MVLAEEMGTEMANPRLENASIPVNIDHVLFSLEEI